MKIGRKGVVLRCGVVCGVWCVVCCVVVWCVVWCVDVCIGIVYLYIFSILPHLFLNASSLFACLATLYSVLISGLICYSDVIDSVMFL